MKKNTFALFAVILIAISIFILLFNPGYLTGNAAINTSLVNLNLSEEISVLVTNSIDFGAGRVYSNASSAILDSNGDISYFFNLTNISSQVGQMPSKRITSMAFDSNRTVSVLYGGFLWTSSYYNDTWEFNHSNNNWNKIISADSSSALPGGKGLLSTMIVYDSNANKIILFGGTSDYSANSGHINETWEYNGINWTKRNALNPPSKRAQHAMVFDSNRNVTVVFGGYDANSLVTSMLWEYNYSENSWTNKSLSGSPSTRRRASMAFDSTRNKVYMFGGSSQLGMAISMPSTILKEVWTYNVTHWVNLTLSGAPSTNSADWIALGYDSSRDRIIVLEERYSVNDITGTYFWDFNPEDNSFSQLSGFSAPNLSMAYSQNNQDFLIFAGTSSSTNAVQYTNNTFILNHTSLITAINGTWLFSRSYFNIENDGTVNISVNYSADNAADAFIGGTNPSFMIKGINSTETNSCSGLNETYAEVLTTSKNICPLLKYRQDTDLFKVPVKLIIPTDVPAGKKNSTITFSATTI